MERTKAHELRDTCVEVIRAMRRTISFLESMGNNDMGRKWTWSEVCCAVWRYGCVVPWQHVRVEFPASVHIHFQEQSPALFPRNSLDDAVDWIRRFGWVEHPLLGYKGTQAMMWIMFDQEGKPSGRDLQAATIVTAWLHDMKNRHLSGKIPPKSAFDVYELMKESGIEWQGMFHHASTAFPESAYRYSNITTDPSDRDYWAVSIAERAKIEWGLTLLDYVPVVVHATNKEAQ